MSYSLKNRCRLCANISRRLQSVDTELSNQINLLFQVEINENEDDKLPKKICRRCLNTVHKCWLSFTEVHRAQKKLDDSIKYEIKLQEASSTSTKDKKVINPIKCKEIAQLLEPAEKYQIIDEKELKVETTEVILKLENEDEETLVLECVISEEEDEEPLHPNESWPDYPWVCSICGEKCGDVQGYTKHQCFELHNRYFCVDCPKAYSRPEPFLAHVSMHHSDRLHNHLLLQCDICQIWFHTKEKQEEHRKDEHPLAEPRMDPENKGTRHNRYHCTRCPRSFATRSNLNFHHRTHLGLKEFFCEECGKSYTRKSVFIKHQKIHYNRREYTCEQCGKGFNQSYHLDEHMILHTDLRPYVCTICDRAFKTPRSLRKHSEIHSEEKLHVCEICGKDFKMPYTLKDHLRSHDDKQFECEFCGKGFGLKRVLKVHRRIHTGEKPYSCTICDKRFSVWSPWNKHMKKCL